MRKKDAVAEKILDIISSSTEPLETMEILSKIKITRTKLLYRLNNLRGEGLIKGKSAGSGKGVWIWWGENFGKKDE